METEIFTGTVLLDKKGNIFLIKEEDKNQVGQGRWNLPGGSIDPHEGVVQAAIREVLEETGYKCKITSILGFYQGYKAGKFWFYIVLGGQITRQVRSKPTDPSVQDGRWFAKKDFLALKEKFLVHPDMKVVYQAALDNQGLLLTTVKFIDYDK